MSRGRLAIHAHFHQPERRDPWTLRVPEQPTAAPYRDWNERIAAECYRPNVERGNLGRISYDLGPNLATWLADHDPTTHAGFVAADRPVEQVPTWPPGRGNAMAQGYHHTILPLAAARDRRTEVRWAVRDFELRYGRRPEGFWLPETAVDLATLRLLVEHGLRYTILAPWQAAEPGIDTRRPYRVEVGAGRSINVVFYDAGLSAAVSFDPAATADADRFARERVAVRLGGWPSREEPLALIASDGELYGHHQQFRDLFLQRLTAPGADVPDRGFDVVDLASVALESATAQAVRIQERTSWSCHHGVARWTHECPCAHDGRWKGPLRAALERTGAAVDAAFEGLVDDLGRSVDPWAARDGYIDVVFGAEPGAAFARRWLGGRSRMTDRDRFLGLMEAQRWRLAMFTSDGWFWDDPIRIETKQVLRCAARSVRLVDALGGTAIERILIEDLALLGSPATGLTGSEIYREALAEVGQPVRSGGRERRATNRTGRPSARGLRSAG